MKKAFALITTIALAGCYAQGDDDSVRSSSNKLVDEPATSASFCVASAATVSDVEFTAQQASNAIDFADSATKQELTAITGVGPAIAKRIMDARPFGMAPSPLAALDQVGYVGHDILTSFRDQTDAAWCALEDGRQSCCTDGCGGLGDTVEQYIEVTDDQAYMVLDWANHATAAQLQQVCYIGPAVAADIMAARPILTIGELAAIPKIGSHAMQNFVGHELFACATKGTVESEWCAQAEASCICTTPGSESCNTPGAQDVTIQEASLPAEIVALLAQWTANPNICDSQSHYANPEFAEAVVHYQDCVVTGYTVSLIQMIDPEGGIYFWIPFELGADFSVQGHGCWI